MSKVRVVLFQQRAQQAPVTTACSTKNALSVNHPKIAAMPLNSFLNPSVLLKNLKTFTEASRAKKTESEFLARLHLWRREGKLKEQVKNFKKWSVQRLAVFGLGWHVSPYTS